MKRSILLFSFIVTMYSTTSAQSNCLIDGKISYLKKGYVVLHYSDDYWLSDSSDTIRLNDTKDFNYIWKFNTPSKQGLLEIDKNHSYRIWGCNKSQLTVNIIDSTSQPEISGTLSRVFRYSQSESVFWSKIFEEFKKRNPEFTKPSFLFSDAYFNIQDSITTERINYLTKFFDNSTKMEELFISQQKNEFVYRDLYYKLSYPHPAIEKFKFYQSFNNVQSPVTYAFSDLIDFNDEDLLYSLAFSKFASTFLTEVVLSYFKTQKIEYERARFYNEVFKVIDKISLNRICNSALKIYMVNDGIVKVKYFGNKEVNTEQFFGDIINTLKGEPKFKVQISILEDNLHKTINDLSQLKKGTTIPSLTFLDSSGKEVNLEQYKGNLIYIDVWASWCGPCIGSMPEWNKLVLKHKKNPETVFITLSIDELQSNWKRSLEKIKPEGLQWISKGGFKSDFCQKFKIYSVPSNILIDKEGKIISLRAERPEIIDLSKYIK